MKTRLYSLPDWQEILREFGWADAPSDNDVEKAIQNELTRGKVTFMEEAPEMPIEKGCRVTVRTESALPKFNKEKTVITIGTGLYDRTVEAQLCGMKTGETSRTMVRGEAVTVTVLKVEKQQLPALTDELVRELQLDGLNDLPSYRSYMDRKIKTEYGTEMTRRIVERLVAGARMDQPAEEDILRVIDLEYEPLRARFSLDSLDPETWKNDFRAELGKYYGQIYPEIASIFGTTSKESYYESRRESAIQTIQKCLVLNAALSEQADPTEDSKAEEKLTQSMTKRLLHVIYGG